MAITPTAEQEAIVAAVENGKNIAVQALAGAGKTFTLRLAAEAKERRLKRGVYVTFNNANQKAAEQVFPGTVLCRTSHALALQAIGRTYGKRLKGGRRTGTELAQAFTTKPFQAGPGRTVSAIGVAIEAKIAVRNFCYTADREIGPWHIRRLDGVTDEETTRAWRAHVLPYAKAMWHDAVLPDGAKANFEHDCQPPGTLVRRVSQPHGRGETLFEDVPIEQIREGDKVVSLTMTKRRGYVRRSGRRVTVVGSRPYNGDLIAVRTANGRQSAYTAEHRCVVRLDTDLSGGNHIVYLARQGDNFRIGRTTWRTKSQGNTLGIRRRAEAQKADAMWILSVHATDREAALEEALVAHRWRLPTWQFQSVNEVMPLEQFWAKVGNNIADAHACLAEHRLDFRFPFWERGDGWNSTRRPVILRAVNLLDGMLVLEPDEMKSDAVGGLSAHEGAGGWSSIAISRSPYEGMVYNLDVDVDHTYVADGIVTHNCYLKIWSMKHPRIDADFIMLDEAQDANGLLLDILSRQNSQLIAVGDSNQQLYAWRKSIDALAKWPADERLSLTESFRFGPQIAEAANQWLAALDCDLKLVGRGPEGQVGLVDRPDAVLCRTNPGAMEQVVGALAAGRKVGMPAKVIKAAKSMAFAAIKLKQGQAPDHEDLGTFSTWREVVDYVHADPTAGDLAVFVRLVEKYGPSGLLDVVGKVKDAARAKVDLTVVTVHGAKGLQWPQVTTAPDFREPVLDEEGDLKPMDPAELQLSYVAVTRAERALDDTSLSWISSYLDGKPTDAQLQTWYDRELQKAEQ